MSIRGLIPSTLYFVQAEAHFIMPLFTRKTFLIFQSCKCRSSLSHPLPQNIPSVNQAMRISVGNALLLKSSTYIQSSLHLRSTSVCMTHFEKVQSIAHSYIIPCKVIKELKPACHSVDQQEGMERLSTWNKYPLGCQ